MKAKKPIGKPLSQKKGFTDVVYPGEAGERSKGFMLRIVDAHLVEVLSILVDVSESDRDAYREEATLTLRAHATRVRDLGFYTEEQRVEAADAILLWYALEVLAGRATHHLYTGAPLNRPVFCPLPAKSGLNN